MVFIPSATSRGLSEYLRDVSGDPFERLNEHLAAKEARDEG
jgi:hypothetical protein